MELKLIKVITGLVQAFFVGKRTIDGKGVYPYLVTNKHIVKDIAQLNKDEMYIRLKEKGTNQFKEYSIGINTFHISSEENVDVAVCFLNAEFIQSKIEKFNWFDIDTHSFTSTEFSANGGDLGSLIYMLGYPMGLVDNFSTLPICRLGCVARFNIDEIKNEKRILLDIQNFPGNSGSPILSKGDLAHVGETKSINKVALIGIVNSYIPYEENLINLQTKKVVEVKTENSGIAIANPVEFIKRLIDEDMNKRQLK